MVIHVNNKWNQATAIPRKLIDDAFTRMNKQRAIYRTAGDFVGTRDHVTVKKMCYPRTMIQYIISSHEHSFQY